MAKIIIELHNKKSKSTSGSTLDFKSDAKILKKLYPNIKPETVSGEYVYIILPGRPKSEVKQLKSKGWKEKPANGVNAFHLGNNDYPGIQLQVTFADDIEEDEYERWGIDEDEDGDVQATIIVVQHI